MIGAGPTAAPAATSVGHDGGRRSCGVPAVRANSAHVSAQQRVRGDVQRVTSRTAGKMRGRICSDMRRRYAAVGCSRAVENTSFVRSARGPPLQADEGRTRVRLSGSEQRGTAEAGPVTCPGSDGTAKEARSIKMPLLPGHCVPRTECAQTLPPAPPLGCAPHVLPLRVGTPPKAP